MPTLEWIGKSKVINHHQKVPFRVLERKYSFDENGQHSEDNGSENMIIRGDNLEALKALLPRYEGRVKCIYIDPPYNTGNEGWVYNDNVNDPKIKKWLGEVVGKEGEDLTRHDKWLCMMYPRLKLLQKLLADDGCLIISISYHELHNLVNLLREIFGTKQIVTVTVQTSGGKPSGGFNYVQEYLVFVVPADFHANALDFCGGNNRTPFEGLTLSTFDKTQRPNQTYPIFICVWRQISGRLQVDWEKGYIKISKNKSGSNQNQYSVQYLPSGVIKKIKDGELEVLGHEDGVPTLLFGENQTVGGQVPTIWAEKAFFTVNGTQTLKNIFPESPKTFDYPKSVALIESVVQAITKDADIILDSFAGSGTTAHAVLNMNKADGGHRKFILVEMMDYADSITAERVKRVIKGYGEGKNAVEGTGGNFSFYDLGEPLLMGDCLNEAVAPEKIREYIWFMETKQPYAPPSGGNPYYLGKHNSTGYYFYYEPQRVTVLDYAFLSTITEKADGTVIYADRCSISEDKLAKMGVTFKKIPRDISRL